MDPGIAITDRYALFGDPPPRSKSPVIHAGFAGETRQDPAYELPHARASHAGRRACRGAIIGS